MVSHIRLPQIVLHDEKRTNSQATCKLSPKHGWLFWENKASKLWAEVKSMGSSRLCFGNKKMRQFTKRRFITITRQSLSSNEIPQKIWRFTLFSECSFLGWYNLLNENFPDLSFIFKYWTICAHRHSVVSLSDPRIKNVLQSTKWYLFHIQWSVFLWRCRHWPFRHSWNQGIPPDKDQEVLHASRHNWEEHPKGYRAVHALLQTSSRHCFHSLI